MKKLLILICLVLSFTLAIGCSANNNINAEGTPTAGNATPSVASPTSGENQLKIQDYFPIKENVKYTYEGKGNEFAFYTVYIDYTSENKVQQRVNNGGTEMAKVLEIKDGKLTLVFIREEVYYRENFLKAESNADDVLLMEPLKQGTTWTLKDSSKKTITNISADVTTPSGNYKAIEVTTEGKNGKTVDYYAKNVGLVKSVFNPGESEVSSTLSKIEENVELKKTVNFYYPNLNDEKIYYQAKELSFKTNDITKMILEKAYKDIVNEKFQKAFTTNTKINSLYLNKDNMVYIDLNSAFINEMNAGAMYEKMILQSVANTFGHYYDKDKVILTIDGKLYESGHILMKKGEFLKVSDEGTEEVK